MAERRHASGPTQPEERRKRKQVKLRLLPIIDYAISECAHEDGVERSVYVERLVRDDVARRKATPQSSEDT